MLSVDLEFIKANLALIQEIHDVRFKLVTDEE